MRKFLIAVVAALVLGSPSAQAQDNGTPGSNGIEATIGAQIEAFRADDFATAFTFASPNIQGLFGTSERFGLMVRKGYPMVWRPDDVQFLELREIGGALWQKVLIRDMAGGLHVLDYQMIRTDDGWKIDGVQLLPAPGMSA